MTCENCGGNDPVTYNWTLLTYSNDDSMDNVDPDSYIGTDVDGSLIADTRGFWAVDTAEAYAFVFRGQ